MVLNLPKKNFNIKVGPYVYRVCYSADIANEGQAFGSTHNDNQRIFIDPQRPLQKMEQTFLHEILHACTFVNGLAYRFEDKETRRPSEEDVVRELSGTLFQFIQDNKFLFHDKANNSRPRRP